MDWMNMRAKALSCKAKHLCDLAPLRAYLKKLLSGRFWKQLIPCAACSHFLKFWLLLNEGIMDWMNMRAKALSCKAKHLCGLAPLRAYLKKMLRLFVISIIVHTQ